jgi:hypothetical protein
MRNMNAQYGGNNRVGWGWSNQNVQMRVWPGGGTQTYMIRW